MALHGVALAMHRFISHRPGYRPWPWFIAQPITLLFVLLCWVPFRAQSFQVTGQIFQRLFVGGGYAVWVPEALGWGIFTTVVFHLLGLSISRRQRHLRRPLVRLLSLCSARYSAQNASVSLSVKCHPPRSDSSALPSSF